MVEPCEGAPPLRQAFSLIVNSSLELDAALLDFIEQEFERHEFGEARRGDKLIAVLLEQHAVAVGIEQQRRWHRSLEAVVLLEGHVGGGVTVGKGRDDQGGGYRAQGPTHRPAPGGRFVRQKTSKALMHEQINTRGHFARAIGREATSADANWDPET